MLNHIHTGPPLLRPHQLFLLLVGLRIDLLRRPHHILGRLLIMLLMLQLIPEKEQDLLDLRQLLPKVPIDDQEDKQVAYVYYYHYHAEYRYQLRRLVQRQCALLLHQGGEVGVDPREMPRIDASMGKSLGQVIRHVVVLTNHIDAHPNFKWIYHCKFRCQAPTLSRRHPILALNDSTRVVEVVLHNEITEISRHQQIRVGVHQMREIRPNQVQLILVQLLLVRDLVAELSRHVVRRCYSDTLVMKGTKSRQRCANLLREEKEAGHVQGQTTDGQTDYGVDYLTAQLCFFWVFSFFEVAVSRQEVLRVDIKVLPRHLYGISHSFRVILKHPHLAIRDIHEVREFILGSAIRAQAIKDHQAVQQEDNSYGGVQHSIFECIYVADCLIDHRVYRTLR